MSLYSVLLGLTCVFFIVGILLVGFGYYESFQPARMIDSKQVMPILSDINKIAGVLFSVMVAVTLLIIQQLSKFSQLFKRKTVLHQLERSFTWLRAFTYLASSVTFANLGVIIFKGLRGLQWAALNEQMDIGTVEGLTLSLISSLFFVISQITSFAGTLELLEESRTLASAS